MAQISKESEQRFSLKMFLFNARRDVTRRAILLGCHICDGSRLSRQPTFASSDKVRTVINF